MKFRITLFDMIEPSPCVLFFLVSTQQMYFLVSTQKTEANFQIFCNGNLISITDVAKILLHFQLWKICNRLKSNLCRCSFFSLEGEFLFNLVLFVCSFYARHLFSLAELGLSIWARQIVLPLDVSSLFFHSTNKYN